MFLIHSSVFNPRLDLHAGLPLRTEELLKPEFNYAACMVHIQLSSHEMPVCQICLSSCAFNRCLFLSKLGRRWEENRAYELGNTLYMAITTQLPFQSHLCSPSEALSITGSDSSHHLQELSSL